MELLPTGVVDEDLDRAEPPLNDSDSGVDARGVGYVQVEPDAASADLRRGVLRVFAEQVGDGDGVALRGELRGDRLADPARPAGDERDACG